MNLLNGHISDEIFATSGVPQGSHLGPLLFILFINDISTVLKFSKILLYANNTKVFLNVKDEVDCQKL